MDTTDDTLQPAESLQLIASVIARTRDNIREHSYCFLLWGWLMAGASLLSFGLQEFTGFRLSFLPFPVAAAVGIVLTFLYFRRRAMTVQSYLDFYMAKLWLAVGIGFILVVLINVFQGNTPFTYTLLMGGIGTFATGAVMRFRPLVAGGALFLLASMASVFLPDPYKALLQGLVFIAGYLVPGYMLRRSGS
ncbi:hypothetical protein [Dinghuibacter silviterrae]|uniref:Uncharacterized protein n=1 Tax=Dinghuibacter silviterrae TaxID=1539049 RepID=A0A4R8DFM3_9BACT|nr:hypothetical protein [Dinghuibacter silviterrae]TDW96399.1 hypothetical protein EDB95_4228 [Dinghuibacter silviterrae]